MVGALDAVTHAGDSVRAIVKFFTREAGIPVYRQRFSSSFGKYLHYFFCSVFLIFRLPFLFSPSYHSIFSHLFSPFPSLIFLTTFFLSALLLLHLNLHVLSFSLLSLYLPSGPDGRLLSYSFPRALGTYILRALDRAQRENLNLGYAINEVSLLFLVTSCTP